MQTANEYILLSELVEEIKISLDENFGNTSYWVVAEISDIRNYPDRKYCFLTLIEKNNISITKMDAAIWQWSYPVIANFESQTNIKFDKNLKLLLQVEVTFNKQYGLRLSVTGIDSSFTLGQVEKERRETLERLLKENPGTIKLVDGNWLTLNNSLEFPIVIQNIALITAPGSDGERDFMHELSANPYGYKFNVSLYLTRIQGQEADMMIIRKLEEIEQCAEKPDVVAIVRGGGSQLDFSAFETYNIAKAVAEFKIPVLTGIGHERNVSIADMMCNTNVKTPTKAASFIIEYNRNFEEKIEESGDVIFSYAQTLLSDARNILNETVNDFSQKTAYFLEKQHYHIENKAVAIKHLNPENILSRGFAIVSHNNKIITDTNQLEKGQEISVRLKNSSIKSTVTGIEK